MRCPALTICALGEVRHRQSQWLERRTSAEPPRGPDSRRGRRLPGIEALRSRRRGVSTGLNHDQFATRTRRGKQIAAVAAARKIAHDRLAHALPWRGLRVQAAQPHPRQAAPARAARPSAGRHASRRTLPAPLRRPGARAPAPRRAQLPAARQRLAGLKEGRGRDTGAVATFDPRAARRWWKSRSGPVVRAACQAASTSSPRVSPGPCLLIRACRAGSEPDRRTRGSSPR